MLDKEDQDFINKIYCNGLNNISITLDQKRNSRLSNLVVKAQKRCAWIQKNGTAEYNSSVKISDKVTKEDVEEVLKEINSPESKEMRKLLTTKEALIFSFIFGHFGIKVSPSGLAKALNMSEEEVENVAIEALAKYNNKNEELTSKGKVYQKSKIETSK